jgi:hypothetical protein
MTCKDKDGNYAWKHWRVMYKNRNWHNYGGPTVSRVKKALCEHGVLVEETVPDELNEGKRRKTGRVCYAD